MKKKLAKLDVKIQIALVAVGLLIFAFVGRTLLVSPKSSQAAEIQKQIDDTESQIAVRQAQSRHSATPQVIKVADLFRLAKAMPDREDMPGIILTISQVARATGVRFDTIEPQDLGPAPIGSYRIRKIHLTFNGDFYALSDFLYRLRNLVTVHDGRLDANGRLFTVQNVTFSLQDNEFPRIGADIVVNAYMYGTGPAQAAPATTAPTDLGATTTGTTDTTATTTTTTTTAATPAAPAPAPADATAMGATP